ncbi:MAG: acyl-ACP--UDP-N-acetylglucosamine O-acyltransferase [Candidatus Omnitrophica bacterium]|nr:acyl-ACP--UDP-N-acetylglucosamine O-acyltransferase [Candidatus Omnitrophota bacterium]
MGNGINIHDTAIISKDAELAEGVTVGPYSVIDTNVKIGPATKIGPYCTINEYTTIGKECEIFQGASIGSISQDKKFKGEKGFLEIGNNNAIREYVTMNRSTEKNGKTVIGNDNLFMAYSHIAHDCIVGNSVTIANCGTLAGHVVLEDGVIIGGLAGVHQFVRMGQLSILGGCSKVVQDIVPYSMVDGQRAKICGINSIGLERAGFSDEAKDSLKKAFKILFSMKLNIKNALKRVEEELPPSEEIKNLVNFIKSSERGIAR